MAIRNIVKIGDDILRKVCRTQLTFDEKLATVLDDMAETMYKAEGVGLKRFNRVIGGAHKNYFH